MSKKRLAVALFLFALCQAAYWFAFVLEATYSRGQYASDDLLPLRTVLSVVPHVTLADLFDTYLRGSPWSPYSNHFMFFWWDEVFALSSISCLVVLLTTHAQESSRLRCICFALQPSLFWSGIFGALLYLPTFSFGLVLEGSVPLSIEVFGERLLTPTAMGLWLIYSTWIGWQARPRRFPVSVSIPATP